ncbi:MAG: hypothetical protein LBV44_06260 [Methylobacillus sp.]|jgi:hypothetical protein|nr:hypothetical protein [Methylobacillus sp.]
MKTTQYVAALLLFLFGGAAYADPAQDCATPEGVARATARIESRMQAVEQYYDKQTKEIEQVIATRAAAENWSNSRKSEFFMEIMNSPEFAAAEKEQEPYAQELTKMMPENASKAEADKVMCMNAPRLLEIIEKTDEVYKRLYDLMLNQAKTMK